MTRHNSATTVSLAGQRKCPTEVKLITNAQHTGFEAWAALQL